MDTVRESECITSFYMHGVINFKESAIDIIAQVCPFCSPLCYDSVNGIAPDDKPCIAIIETKAAPGWIPNKGAVSEQQTVAPMVSTRRLFITIGE